MAENDETYKVWRGTELRDGTVPPEVEDPQTGGGLYTTWTIGMEPGHAMIGYVCVRAGQRCGPHTHETSSHYTSVVSGTALLWVDGTMLTLEPGDVYTVAPGVLHDLGAGPDEDCYVVESTVPLPLLSDPEQMARALVWLEAGDERHGEIAAAFASAQSA